MYNHTSLHEESKVLWKPLLGDFTSPPQAMPSTSPKNQKGWSRDDC